MYLLHAINTSILQHLRKDLGYLQEMWPVLLNVINYENSTNKSDILLLLYLNSCKEKVKDVVNSLQNIVSDNFIISLMFYYFTFAV